MVLQSQNRISMAYTNMTNLHFWATLRKYDASSIVSHFEENLSLIAVGFSSADEHLVEPAWLQMWVAFYQKSRWCRLIERNSQVPHHLFNKPCDNERNVTAFFFSTKVIQRAAWERCNHHRIGLLVEELTAAKSDKKFCTKQTFNNSVDGYEYQINQTMKTTKEKTNDHYSK